MMSSSSRCASIEDAVAPPPSSPPPPPPPSSLSLADLILVLTLPYTVPPSAPATAWLVRLMMATSAAASSTNSSTSSSAVTIRERIYELADEVHVTRAPAASAVESCIAPRERVCVRVLARARLLSDEAFAAVFAATEAAGDDERRCACSACAETGEASLVAVPAAMAGEPSFGASGAGVAGRRGDAPTIADLDLSTIDETASWQQSSLPPATKKSRQSSDEHDQTLTTKSPRPTTLTASGGMDADYFRLLLSSPTRDTRPGSDGSEQPRHQLQLLAAPGDDEPSPTTPTTPRSRARAPSDRLDYGINWIEAFKMVPPKPKRKTTAPAGSASEAAAKEEEEARCEASRRPSLVAEIVNKIEHMEQESRRLSASADELAAEAASSRAVTTTFQDPYALAAETNKVEQHKEVIIDSSVTLEDIFSSSTSHDLVFNASISLDDIFAGIRRSDVTTDDYYYYPAEGSPPPRRGENDYLEEEDDFVLPPEVTALYSSQPQSARVPSTSSAAEHVSIEEVFAVLDNPQAHGVILEESRSISTANRSMVEPSTRDTCTMLTSKIAERVVELTPHVATTPPSSPTATRKQSFLPIHELFSRPHEKAPPDDVRQRLRAGVVREATTEEEERAGRSDVDVDRSSVDIDRSSDNDSILERVFDEHHRELKNDTDICRCSACDPSRTPATLEKADGNVASEERKRSLHVVDPVHISLEEIFEGNKKRLVVSYDERPSEAASAFLLGLSDDELFDLVFDHMDDAPVRRPCLCAACDPSRTQLFLQRDEARLRQKEQENERALHVVDPCDIDIDDVFNKNRRERLFSESSELKHSMTEDDDSDGQLLNRERREGEDIEDQEFQVDILLQQAVTEASTYTMHKERDHADATITVPTSSCYRTELTAQQSFDIDEVFDGVSSDMNPTSHSKIDESRWQPRTIEREIVNATEVLERKSSVQFTLPASNISVGDIFSKSRKDSVDTLRKESTSTLPFDRSIPDRPDWRRRAAAVVVEDADSMEAGRAERLSSRDLDGVVLLADTPADRTEGVDVEKIFRGVDASGSKRASKDDSRWQPKYIVKETKIIDETRRPIMLPEDTSVTIDDIFNPDAKRNHDYVSMPSPISIPKVVEEADLPESSDDSRVAIEISIASQMNETGILSSELSPGADEGHSYGEGSRVRSSSGPNSTTRTVITEYRLERHSSASSQSTSENIPEEVPKKKSVVSINLDDVFSGIGENESSSTSRIDISKFEPKTIVKEQTRSVHVVQERPHARSSDLPASEITVDEIFEAPKTKDVPPIEAARIERTPVDVKELIYSTEFEQSQKIESGISSEADDRIVSPEPPPPPKPVARRRSSRRATQEISLRRASELESADAQGNVGHELSTRMNGSDIKNDASLGADVISSSSPESNTTTILETSQGTDDGDEEFDVNISLATPSREEQRRPPPRLTFPAPPGDDDVPVAPPRRQKDDILPEEPLGITESGDGVAEDVREARLVVSPSLLGNSRLLVVDIPAAEISVDDIFQTPAASACSSSATSRFDVDKWQPRTLEREVRRPRSQVSERQVASDVTSLPLSAISVEDIFSKPTTKHIEQQQPGGENKKKEASADWAYDLLTEIDDYEKLQRRVVAQDDDEGSSIIADQRSLASIATYTPDSSSFSMKTYSPARSSSRTSLATSARTLLADDAASSNVIRLLEAERAKEQENGGEKQTIKDVKKKTKSKGVKESKEHLEAGEIQRKRSSASSSWRVEHPLEKQASLAETATATQTATRGTTATDEERAAKRNGKMWRIDRIQTSPPPSAPATLRKRAPFEDREDNEKADGATRIQIHAIPSNERAIDVVPAEESSASRGHITKRHSAYERVTVDVHRVPVLRHHRVDEDAQQQQQHQRRALSATSIFIGSPSPRERSQQDYAGEPAIYHSAVSLPSTSDASKVVFPLDAGATGFIRSGESDSKCITTASILLDRHASTSALFDQYRERGSGARSGAGAQTFGAGAESPLSSPPAEVDTEDGGAFLLGPPGARGSIRLRFTDRERTPTTVHVSGSARSTATRKERAREERRRRRHRSTIRHSRTSETSSGSSEQRPDEEETLEIEVTPGYFILRGQYQLVVSRYEPLGSVLSSFSSGQPLAPAALDFSLVPKLKRLINACLRRRSRSVSMSLSGRGVSLLDAVSASDRNAAEAHADPFHREHNPKGKINMASAQNRVCEEEVTQRLAAARVSADEATLCTRYGPRGGQPETKRLLCAHFSRVTGAEISPADCVLLPSCTAAYDLLSHLVCDPHDVILTPAPLYYRFFNDCTDRSECRVVPVHMDPHKPRLSVAAFEQAYTIEAAKGEHVRALILANPHNPLGNIFSVDEVLALCEWAASNDIFIFFDEILSGTIYRPATSNFRSILTVRERLPKPQAMAWMNSFSKDLGLPAVGCALIYVPSPPLRQALARLEALASVPAPSQLIITQLLEDQEWLSATLSLSRARLAAHAAFVAESLRAIGIPLKQPAAGVCLFADFSRYLSADTCPNEQALWRRFSEAGVILTTGESSACDEAGWMRVAFGGPKEEVELGVQRIYEALGVAQRVESNITYPPSAASSMSPKSERADWLVASVTPSSVGTRVPLPGRSTAI